MQVCLPETSVANNFFGMFPVILKILSGDCNRNTMIPIKDCHEFKIVSIRVEHPKNQ